MVKNLPTIALPKGLEYKRVKPTSIPNVTIADISEPAKRWIDFLRYEVGISDPPIELALEIYNMEFEDIDNFLRQVEYNKDDVDISGFYLYDFIYENIEEYLSDGIDRILGSWMRLLSVWVVKDPRSDNFTALGAFASRPKASDPTATK